jgi:hypothetical protein
MCHTDCTLGQKEHPGVVGKPGSQQRILGIIPGAGREPKSTIQGPTEITPVPLVRRVAWQVGRARGS